MQPARVNFSPSASECVQNPPSDSSLRRASVRVGTVLQARYRLESLLGVGGMAAVYAAVHLRNGNRVAIKILHNELAGNDDLCSRFLREGYLSNAVLHPGAVHVLDDDITDDGSLFLVMELLDGESLETRWRQRGCRLPIGEAMPIVSDVLDVLAAAHSKGIVHRDVKPDNVFLTTDGRIKLLDFGVAQCADLATAKTGAGTVLGTAGFMAPEQALGRIDEVDASSDIWSVGALVFTLVSGRLVHPGATVAETIARTAILPAPPLADAFPQVPARIASIVDRALALQKHDRWPSARAMRDALQLAFADASDRTAEACAPAEPVPEPRAERATAALALHPATPRSCELARRELEGLGVSPGEVSQGEARKWRRDLRRGRGAPLLLAGAFGLALAGTAARTPQELQGDFRALSPRGASMLRALAQGSTRSDRPADRVKGERSQAPLRVSQSPDVPAHPTSTRSEELTLAEIVASAPAASPASAPAVLVPIVDP
ncbi:MAG TPA: serine/threonine-protein kinase [Polyangiaceae bacterium]|nr:serine/threonine-protein kinase [Polyangiaceae bacterium]